MSQDYFGENLRFVKKKEQTHRLLPIPFTEIWKEEFFSRSPPAVFIGSKLKYPIMNVGILAPPEQVVDAWRYNAQSFWAEHRYGIRDILKLRGNLINSRFQTTAKSSLGVQNSHFLDIAQEIGTAKNQVELEIRVKKKVKMSLTPDDVALPVGPRASLQYARITSNTKVEVHVDKAVSDTDWTATEALPYLFSHNIDEQMLSQLLSIGMLGRGKDRKLVPTRWSITATDDLLGKDILKSVKQYPVMNEYELYVGSYLGNYYAVILLPEIWSYELFELYLPGSAWNQRAAPEAATDDEGFEGRKTYAEHCAGGYYAARLPLLHSLLNRRRQAAALVIRCETPEYWAGLGVWVVREAMKKTMLAQPRRFNTLQEATVAATQAMKTAVNFDIASLFQRSKLLRKIKTQVKLTSFF